MGKKKTKIRKVVLDTNVLISALLFSGGLSGIVDLWRSGKIVPILSRETFLELRAVLEYPKFSLTRREIKMIIEDEVLRYFEITEISDRINGICRDPEDEKFISCAVSAAADAIVTGDRDLLDIGECKSVKIVSASVFLKMFGPGEG